MPLIGVVLGCLSCDHANTRTIGTGVPKTARPKRYETAFQMLHNYAPVLCVRSVIRLAMSTQLRWMNRSWAGVQKVKGVAFTIRQSSLERLRYVPERLR